MTDWAVETELLLAEWSEKASCYRWLHSRSEKKYKRKYYGYSIPIIILSTLTGTANFAMKEYVPEDNQKIATAIVGGFNILAGILGTLQTFLKVCETMESHRAQGVAWSKLGRNISIELALDPKRRQPNSDFLKMCRGEYDRLIEQSPMIDDDIISQFKSKFKNYKVSKPSITNGLDACHIFKINPQLAPEPEILQGIKESESEGEAEPEPESEPESEP